MAFQLKLGQINFTEYKAEIFAILMLIAVGYAVYKTYKTMKFRSD